MVAVQVYVSYLLKFVIPDSIQSVPVFIIMLQNLSQQTLVYIQIRVNRIQILRRQNNICVPSRHDGGCRSERLREK